MFQCFHIQKGKFSKNYFQNYPKLLNYPKEFINYPKLLKLSKSYYKCSKIYYNYTKDIIIYPNRNLPYSWS